MRQLARVSVLGLLGLATVTATTGVAALSASAAPARNQSNGAKLDRALHAWAGFPVKSSPRPLVLLQGYVLNPDGGFSDDNGKEAFLDGAMTAPASWPASPASSMGFPIVGAAAAFETLTTPTTNSLAPRPPPLAVSAVQLGSGLFLTDRGWRVLPAWLFSFSGVQNPAKVLALAPSAIFSAAITRGGMSPSQMSAIVGPNGRKLVATFVGAAAGTGPCTASYSLSFKESKQAVALSVTSHPHGAANEAAVACTLVGYARHATVTLRAPLGARVVVDASTEGAMAATRESSGSSGATDG